MAAIRPRDLLSDDLLAGLGRPGGLTRDIARLAEVGYLNVALPPEHGGLGCTLRQAACGQRRLARQAPETALAVSAHLYWTGAAADACRAGDDSMRWLLLEAARGALIAGGHGGAGGDLKFADPASRCESDGSGNYLFRDRGALSTLTPPWDWVAVHALHVPALQVPAQPVPAQPAAGRSAAGRSAAARPRSVIAFAGRGDRCTPAFRVARVCPAGTAGDVFTTSALTWGHSILASVQYSDARRAFNDAISACAEAATPAAFTAPGPAGPSSAGPSSAGPSSAGRNWPLAETSARLDAMKAKIAEITHPWQLVQEPAPDLGGQHLISLHAMRHEIAEGAASVHALVARLTGAQTPARYLSL